MTAILKGTTALTEESRSVSWTQATGWESTFRYKGSWANVAAELATPTSLTQNASRIDARQESGGYGVLEVSFAAQDNTEANVNAYEEETDTWTLQPAKYQFNIWEHKLFDPLDDDRIVYSTESGYLTTANYRGTKYRIRMAVDAYLAAVQSNIEGGNKDDSKVDLHDKLKEWDEPVNNVANPYGGLTSTQKQLALDLVNMLLNGKDTDESSRYVLRNTKIVPGNANFSLAHKYVERQWTNSEMHSYIDDNKLDGVTKAGLLTELSSSDAPFLGTYWFKEAPVIHEVQGGKFEIVQEWVNYKAGEKSSLLYPYFGRL